MTENNNEEKNRALDRPHQYPFASPMPEYFIREKAEEEVHLRDYLHVIMRRKWIVITFLIVVVTSATIAAVLMKPQYKATTTIKIDKENPHILNFKDVIGLEMTKEDYYQTQYKVLKSRNLAKRVIRSLKLYTHPEFATERKGKETSDEDNLLKQNDPLKDKSISPGLIDAFIDDIDVNPVQRSRLVNVSFTSHDPELSAKVANEIGKSFIGLNIESKFEATYQARIWLEKQLDIMKAKVEHAEEELNKYAADNEIIFLNEDLKGESSDNENIVSKKLSELSTELTEAISDRISKEALYREIRTGDPGSSSVVMNNALILSLKGDLAEHESEYNEQLKIYKADYPKMVVLKERIDQIKKKMDMETKKVILSVKKDYEVAKKRENQLKTTLASLKKDALDLNQRSIQYQILKRESDTNKELYNGLLQRLKETGVSSSLTASNIQVLDIAEVPKKPFKPNKSMYFILSVIFGLFGGIGFAFFTEYLDNTIKTPEDIEKRTPMPQIGLVPRHTDNKEIIPIEKIALSDFKSPIGEAYRSITTFLLLSTGGKPPRVMVVTSPERGEGKTTTAINIAISLTKLDIKVLLIDADMRKPRLHKIFGLDNDIGLSSFLSGNAGFGDGLVKKSEIQNLDVITSGRIPPNPAELLSSYRFQELVVGFNLLYNFIIIDTPPVIGLSDSLIVSPHSDGVILVVKSGATHKEAIQQARKMIQNVNKKILGVILNSVNKSDMKYSYYYNYYKYYYTNEYK